MNPSTDNKPSVKSEVRSPIHRVFLRFLPHTFSKLLVQTSEGGKASADTCNLGFQHFFITTLTIVSIITIGGCRPHVPNNLVKNADNPEEAIWPHHPDSAEEIAIEKVPIEELFLTPQPSFLWLPNTGKIADSQRTVAAIARYKRGTEDLTFLSAAEQRRVEAEEPEWQTKIIQNATDYLQTLTPKFVRDKNNILNAIVLDGDKPITSAILFTPELYNRFNELLGPEFLVVVPTRNKVLLFPKLATKIEAFAPPILSEYRIAPYPISIEVFEVSPNGVRAVGMLDDK